MLQELNEFSQRHDEIWLARLNDNLIKAIGHTKFCIELYRMQMDDGRHWVQGHLWSAKSRRISDMEELLRDPRVRVAYAEQC